MATTTASLQYGSYVFNPVPQIGLRSSSNPLGANKSGPDDRVVVASIVGRILGVSFNDIQNKMAALTAAFAKQDQTLYWNDGTTTRINQAAKVLTFDFPAEWGTYEQTYTITLTYLPLDDTNAAPFLVKYGSYTFSPIPIFGRQMKTERESIDSTIESQRWTLSLSGYIDKGSIAANLTEWAALQAALAVDDTFQYSTFIQSVKMVDFDVTADTWQRKINYSITMQYVDGFTTANVIKLSSARSISRVTDRVAKHLIPFIDYAQVQVLGLNGQSITAVGYIIGTTMANARTAANTEINAQFPAPPTGVLALDEESSKITEKYEENRVDWNVTRFYTAPVLSGGLYGG